MRTFKLGCAVAATVMVSTSVSAEIISAAGLQDFEAEPVEAVSTVAGRTVVATPLNALAKAQTDYGVNRIFNASQRNDQGETYASSVWAETFTAQGAGMVRVSLSFTVDGSVDYGALGSGRDANYHLTALKGRWGLSAVNGYDDITARAAVSTQYYMNNGFRQYTGHVDVETDSDADAFYFSGATATGTQLERFVERDGDSFNVTMLTQNPSGFAQQRFTPTHLIENGVSRPYGAFPPAGAVYQSMRNNYPILGRAALCADADGEDDGCLSGTYPPTTVSLAFDVLAGTEFTIVSALMSENAEDGTVDFFNTVRLSDIAVSGGTIVTDNAQFRNLGNGTYGFAPAMAVPEPASWALMIAGFALAGAGARRRRPSELRTA